VTTRVGIVSGLFILAAITLLARCPAASSRTPSSDEGVFSGIDLGVRVGTVFAQHTGTEERDSEYEVASRWRIGTTMGIFAYWPVTKRFGLQQGVTYAQKGSYQKIDVRILEVPTRLDVTYEMDYLEIPVLMRLSWLQWERSEVYSLTGTALSLRIHDRYRLAGQIDDGQQVVPVQADADMAEVDLFDYSFVHGLGWGFTAWKLRLLIEYRFTIGWNSLAMPTYAYVPFGNDQILVENEPVPLKNQLHSVTVGIRF